MISISREDVINYELIRSGGFGSVYKVDNLAYKIYHPKIHNVMGIVRDNPVLTLSTGRFERLQSRSKDLLYTKSIQDYIYIDGHFGGVVLPFFEGSLLREYKHASFQLKRNFSNQLIRNHQELQRNLIFPYDYKLNNVIVNDNEIKIIDLDDVLTSIPIYPTFYHYMKSNYSLSKCMIQLFQDNWNSASYQFREYLQNTKIKPTYSVDDLKHQLEKKEEEHNFCLLNSTSKNIPIHPTYHYLFSYDENDSKEAIYQIIDKLYQKGIILFDILTEEKKEDYFEQFHTNICIDDKENVLYKGKKL